MESVAAGTPALSSYRIACARACMHHIEIDKVLPSLSRLEPFCCCAMPPPSVSVQFFCKVALGTYRHGHSLQRLCRPCTAKPVSWI